MHIYVIQLNCMYNNKTENTIQITISEIHSVKKIYPVNMANFQK